jgi:uncharacterized NAD-dependent epimerase/dehydratase family protein
LVLCHRHDRRFHRNSDVPIPPLPQYIDLYERLLGPLHPGRVCAVSLNTYGLSDAEAAEACRQVTEDTGLPCADVVREGDDGVDKLVEAVLACCRAAGKPCAPDYDWERTPEKANVPIGLQQ